MTASDALTVAPRPPGAGVAPVELPVAPVPPTSVTRRLVTADGTTNACSPVAVNGCVAVLACAPAVGSASATAKGSTIRARPIDRDREDVELVVI